MRTIENQIVVTSGVDLHGESIPVERLKDLYEQMPDSWLLNNDHDFSKPPIAFGYNKKFGKIQDGKWAIMVDVDILDEEEFKKMGGFSISYLRNLITMNPSKAGDVEILFNPMSVGISEINDLIKLSNEKLQIDARELIQKAFEIPFVLILKFSSIAFFTAFFGKMGSDTWDFLRHKIKILAERKGKQKESKPPICQFMFKKRQQDNFVEVIVTVRVDAFKLIERKSQALEPFLESIFSSSKQVAFKRIAISFDENSDGWQMDYGLTQDDKILKF